MAIPMTQMFLTKLSGDVDMSMLNQVPWYYTALTILVGGALLSHGVTMVSHSWETELKLPNWFSVAGQGFGIVLSAVLGCVAGDLVWEWELGGMVGLVGAFSSTLILSLLRAKLGVVKETLDVGADKDQNK